MDWISAETIAKFEARVGPVEPSGCRLWTGALFAKGYGSVYLPGIGKRGRSHPAHRVALGIALGRPVRPDRMALHSCDTPACVEPSHLREGTHEENMEDMLRRGRGVRIADYATPRAKLTEDDVRAIRAAYASGAGRGDLSRAYGVTFQAITLVVQRKTWTHV